MPRIVIIVLLVWLTFGSVMAQSPQRIRFEHLTVADGLPGNSVLCMLQDHLGFMWLGTPNGLVRYDGTKMTAFHSEPTNSFSLKGTQIQALHEDRNGDIWIGCESLVRFERATQRFIAYPRKSPDKLDKNDLITFIHEDKRGDIWTITDRRALNAQVLDRLRPNTNSWTYFRHAPKDNHSLASNSICLTYEKQVRNYAFLEDKTGEIWITTSGETENILHKFDSKSTQFSRAQLKVNPQIAADFKKITVLAQDNRGYLYLASFDGGKGLFVFNPQTGQIHQFKHDPANPASLRCDSVIKVHQSRDGLIWVPTQQGLDRLDPKTGIFTHLISSPSDPASPSPGLLEFLSEMPGGDLWFLTNNGLNLYSGRSHQFVRYHHSPDQKDELHARDGIASFFIDRTGLIWAGGLNSGLNKQSLLAQFSRLPALPNSSPTAIVYSIYQAPSDPSVIWFGTTTGLVKHDLRTGQYEHYRYDSLNPQSINKGPVLAIVEDKRGRFWVTTWKSGLNLMDRKKGTFSRYSHNPANANSLITNKLYSLLPASDGSLWTSTRTGLGHVDIDRNRFTRYYKADSTYTPNLYARISQLATPDHRVASIEHPGDNIDKTIDFTLQQSTELLVVAGGHWVPTGKFDYGWIEDAQKKIVWETSYANSVGDGLVGQVRNQVNIIRLAAGRYRLRYKSDEDYSYGNWSSNPVPYHPDLWGIQLTQLKSMEAKQVALLMLKRQFKGLSGNDIICLEEDAKKQIWIGSEDGGVSLFSPLTGKSRTFFDQFNGPIAVDDILEDTKSGCVWVCDYVFGLLLLDANGRTLKHYTVANGLPSNTVYTIQRDDKGYLWVGTSNGLSRFDPKTEQFRNYNQRNGLPDLDLRRSFKTGNGDLYFSSDKVMNVFFPSQLEEDRFPPPVVLSDLFIGEKPATLGKDGQLPVHVSIADQITLPYDQNDLTFHYAALQYNRGNESQYAFKLVPTDKDWLQAGTTQQARYSDLSPGTYTFQVKAANADGVWNEKGTSIIVTILPPWWRTWWAYLLYTLVIGGSIWAFIEYRSRALRRENQVLEEKVTLRTSQLQHKSNELEHSLETLKTTQTQLVQKEKMASLGELTAGIAHEIQNPLNFVNNFSELSSELVEELEEEHQKPLRDADLEVELLTDLKDNLHKILHHGNRAAGIVKGMLEHARSSTGEMAPTDLNKLANEFLRLAYHGMRGNDKAGSTGRFNCELVTEFDPALGQVSVMPQEMGRVLLNLFNNAFYAVRQQQSLSDAAYRPTISVRTSRVNGQVVIRVQDNGMGMSEGVKAKIFQPFFTTKPTGEGTGLGLSLSYDIVTKGHGGSLTVTSQEGQGTEFVLSFPSGSTLS